ncbi:MAG: SagB/ThcOx family dehydrogenase [Oscillospiraceae bacterium]|nr:SagB/ThcOx family dehydrogenase [Oscillospiraceae bacterium]
MNDIMQNREFMKCPSFLDGMRESDQQKGIPHPAYSKPAVGALTTLPAFGAIDMSYDKLLDIRRSERKYDETKPMSREELAFILWSAGGIQEVKGHATLRPTPSGGARHPFELYIAVQNVESLAAGLYRYIPAENIGKKTVSLEYLGVIEGYKNRLTDAVFGQRWAASAAACLFVSCLPYKAEWRYCEMAHRVILIDLGHLGQNVMLSAAALGLGSCCMAAYDQKLCDEFLGLDGVDEYTVYVISLGETK